MASTDARPIPRKNVAYRVTFPILDASGALVTGAAGLDSEVSKDQGTAADCTNEATEIATATGLYYLDLTSTEMNADTVAILVKTSTPNAKTTVIILYPEELGDLRIDPATLTAPDNAGIAAIKAKTDNLPSDPADASDISTAIAALASTLSTILAAVDTEVAAIKARTDLIPAAPATEGTLGTVATAVAVIQAKTDLLPSDPADASVIAGLIDALPTAIENADALLARDLSAVTGEAARSVLNALRPLRNRVVISGTTLTIYEEDDTTIAWTAQLATSSAARPVTSMDPS